MKNKELWPAPDRYSYKCRLVFLVSWWLIPVAREITFLEFYECGEE